MKIKRIIFVVIIIIISLTTNIYAAKIPGKNASSSEISKYLETNDWFQLKLCALGLQLLKLVLRILLK